MACPLSLVPEPESRVRCYVCRNTTLMEENMKARKPLLAALLVCALALVACTIPAWVNTVEADAEIAVPIAASLIDVIDPALASLVSLIEGGFNALVKTLDTYKASQIGRA